MDIVKDDEISDVIANMDDSSTYVITRHKSEKDKVQVPYTMMGNGITSKHTGKSSLDILRICEELNRSQLALFRYFRDAYINNSIHGEIIPHMVSTIRDENMTPYLKIALKKGYAHMEYLGVLKRVRRGMYMINPHLIVPSKNNDEVFEAWDELGEQDDTED